MSLTLAALLLAAFALTGCDILSSDDAVHGRVRVHLTDAPLDDFTEVNVEITRVELLGEDDVYVITDEAQVYDLLQLQNGVTATMGEAEVPAGRYHQLRLIVSDEAEVRYVDGSEVKIPSGQQTGIKVIFPSFEIEEEGDVVELTVDFDVNESFVKAGESGQYIFKPVLKAEALVVNGVDVDVEEEEVQEEETEA